jgi:hypothetical protein
MNSRGNRNHYCPGPYFYSTHNIPTISGVGMILGFFDLKFFPVKIVVDGGFALPGEDCGQ